MEADSENNLHVALSKYLEAVDSLAIILRSEDNEDKQNLVRSYIAQYSVRIEEILLSLQHMEEDDDDNNHSNHPDHANASRETSRKEKEEEEEDDDDDDDDEGGGQGSSTDRRQDDRDETKAKADFALEMAIKQDEAGRRKDAYEHYLVAAEAFMAVLKSDAYSKEDQAWATSRLTSVLDRAEQLKTPAGSTSSPAKPTKRKPRGRERRKSSGPGGKGGYTEQEKSILAASSTVNGNTFVPFLEYDLDERFSYGTPYTDPCGGILELSDKQAAVFGGWMRPREILKRSAAKPQMIVLISAHSIKQTLITDCSFISAIAVSAMYERRFKKQLITSCIYPQDARGQPVYNPSGKYMIRMYFNGVARKVCIDDRLPVSRSGRLLCSHSSTPGELWVSLIEKAFLTVHGGYAFPGSNSGVDLHMLTGWIPESLTIRTPEFDADRVWERMLSGLSHGDCVLTIATGDDYSESEYTSLGLVPAHAYAVLDLQVVVVGGKRVRFALIKNPWSNVSWKGKYSRFDAESWTPQLARALNYDVKAARSRDNGVFWIDYESLLGAYSRIHMSWNPGLFAHRYVLHDTLSNRIGPRNDRYNLGYNPQFGVVINNAGPNDASVWVLLSRHVTTKEERAEDYITIHVYENTRGGRVYYSENALVRGTYINSPHYLARFDAPPGKRSYTLVVSQYERVNAINFTLNVYGTAPFAVKKPGLKWPNEVRIKGRWTASTAGGSCNSPASFAINPQYLVTLHGPSRVRLKIESSDEHSVNAILVAGSSRISAVYTTALKLSTDSYRPGFAMVDSEDVLDAGEYVLVVSTYGVGEVGDYVLGVGALDAVFDVSAM